MDLRNEIAALKSPSLRRSLIEAAPITLSGALAILMGALMQPLPGARPVRDGLIARTTSGTISLHQQGQQVGIRHNGTLLAQAGSLAALEDAFFDALFARPAEPLALAA